LLIFLMMSLAGLLDASFHAAARPHHANAAARQSSEAGNVQQQQQQQDRAQSAPTPPAPAPAMPALPVSPASPALAPPAAVPAVAVPAAPAGATMSESPSAAPSASNTDSQAAASQNDQTSPAGETNSVPATTNGSAPLRSGSSTNPPQADSNTDPVRRSIEAGDSTDLSQSFEVRPGGKMTMNVDRGDVRITASDESVANVPVTRKVTGAGGREATNILKDEQVVLKQNGNEISITTQNPSELRHFSLFNHPNLQSQYEIMLPRHFDVHVETAGGEISVSDVQGSVHLETAGGDINVSGTQGSADVTTAGGRIICDNIVGDVHGQTAGGDLRATGCKGRLNLDTAGGSVTIIGFAGPGVEATTSGGSVSADFAAAPTEDSKLKSSGGNINVHLPENAALQLDGRTSAGLANSDFPVEIKNNFNNGTLSGAINGGGPVLRMETEAGDVDVMKN
jgi:DUF4097 and DUF4098 domain-containing protein YvlB